MKALRLSPCIALFVFGIVCCYSLFIPPSFASSNTIIKNATSQSFPLVPSVAQPSNEVQIEFLQFNRIGYNSYNAVFHIVNESSEPLYYFGNNENYPCFFKIKSGNEVRQESPCFCVNGLVKQSLLPGKSADFYVEADYFGWTNKIQVGFDFQIGQERREQTIWSDEIILSKSISFSPTLR